MLIEDHLYYDVCIIGAGVIGASVAYYLSQYDIKVLVLDKDNDVSQGTSKANSAIIHAGYDPHPNTIMADTNVRGNKIIHDLVKILNVDFRNIGSYVISFSEEDDAHIKKLYERGLTNKVPGLKIVDRNELLTAEPNISDKARSALYAPTAGVINPWEFTIALTQVARREGVNILLNSEVVAIDNDFNNEVYYIKCKNNNIYKAKYVINAAGVYADIIHNMVAKPDFKIIPTKGEYYLIDKITNTAVNSVLFQCPNKDGKGVLVSNTVHHNIIVGPNAEIIEDRDDVSDTAFGLQQVVNAAKKTVPSLEFYLNLRNFAGIRANTNKDDFICAFAADRFYDIAGIKSPGLSSAPALAIDCIEALKKDGLKLIQKKAWDGSRKFIRFKDESAENKQKLIESRPEYGKIVCRCMSITEAEIIDAILDEGSSLALDAVKRRCGAGLGRCQAGFCGPKILELIVKYRNCKPEDVLLDKTGSNIIFNKTK